VHQQPALFPDLTVAENLALGIETRAGWQRVDWAGRRERARSLLARLGASIDPDRTVSQLTMPEQQLVEIARALGADARLMILDEPTASLTVPEVRALLAVVRRLRDEGVAIVYVSHRLEEVIEIADRVSVLRDGRTVGTVSASDATTRGLVRMIVGDELHEPPARAQGPRAEVALEVRGLSSHAAGIRDVSFILHRGEVLGWTGLVGSGRTQLAETLFGITPADTGEVVIEGRPLRPDTPDQAIAAGIGYVPEDRIRHGVVLDMSVAANSTLASLPKVTTRGLVDRRAETLAAQHWITELSIKTESTTSPASWLSGGNQQKVAVARWLMTQPRVLILDEPTQGVDVRSKGEIHRIISDLAARGLAVVVISSDIAEVISLSDRILVMRGGTVAGELPRAEASPHTVLALALGTESTAGYQ
jgi:rhamnose transport system ATP-binding protein